MVLKKYIKKYKVYEAKELSKRKKLKAYKALKKKKKVFKKPPVKFNKVAYTKSIGNPYGANLPKKRKKK